MENTKFYTGVVALLSILSGCHQQKSSLISRSLVDQKEIAKPRQFTALENKKIKKAEKQYRLACEDHADAFYVFRISEGDQDKELKKIIFRKSKDWAKKYWSAERWFGVGINEYYSLQFLTYSKSLKKHLKNLEGWKSYLEKRNYDGDSLLQDITTIIPKFKDLLDLTESHDRYLQEKDKRESMNMTKQMNTLMYLKMN